MPLDLNIIPNPPKPTMTLRQAQKALTDELIRALSDRPWDFAYDHFLPMPGRSSAYTLDDRKTGQRWWIANGFWFFRLNGVVEPGSDGYNPICSCRELKLGGWNKLRAWWAVKSWMMEHPRGYDPPAVPQQHEAERLRRANEAM